MNTGHQLPEFMDNPYTRKAQAHLQQKRFYLWSKRGFDIVLSLLLLILLLPVFLVLGVCIKLEDGGPIFYRQERITQFGKTFRIFKFRTMILNADKIGPLVTKEKDPRVTKIGHKIRNYRLDEIPQLLNVLNGEMSFVGTRPEVQKYVDYYTEEMQVTLLMPAGVTSLASIEFRHETEKIAQWTEQGLTTDEAYVQHILPEKMTYNIDYIAKASLWNDCKLMLQTVLAVLH